MSAAADRHSAPDPASPFPRPLVVDDVPDDGLAHTIEADAAECANIAAAIGLPGLRRLSARFRIAWQSSRRLQVEGAVEASITQVCVVSLEPFDSDVTQAIDIAFAPPPPPDPVVHQRAATASRRQHQRRHDAERYVAPPPVQVIEGEVDPPDPIVDGRIDLGAIAVEFLTLSLDLYPKKPGVHFSDVVVGEEAQEKPSAFADLVRLKDRS